MRLSMKELLSNHSIARRLQLGVGVAAGLVLGLTVWFNYRVSRDELERQTNAKAVTEIGAAARRLDDFIARIAMLPRDIAVRQQALGRAPDPGMVAYLRELLQQTPVEEVYGLYIAYEHMDWKNPGACLAVHRKNWPALTAVEYDYHDVGQEWYHGPKRSRALYVTEPYFDEGAGNISMVSLTTPVFDEATNFIGVAGADLALDRIRALMHVARLAKTERGGTNAFAYLVSRAGKIIAHPKEELMLRKGFAGADLTSRPGGQLVAANPEGFAATVIDGERRRLYWATSPLSGWKIVLNIPEDDILIPVRELTLRSGLAGAAGLLLLVLLVTALARHFTRPLLVLTRSAAAIEEGKFREQMLGVLPDRHDEMGELARSFRKMAHEIHVREQSLAELNENLERTVTQRTAELTARAGELQNLTHQSQERVVLESSLSALNTSLRGNLTAAQVAAKGLAGAIEFLGAPAGALFVVGAEGALLRLAAHAYPDSPDLPKSFTLGSGTIGQAAQSRRPLYTEPDGGRLRVHFGFGAVAPAQVVAYPLLANDTPVGVMELCLFKPLTETQSRWLGKAAETVANALRFALESEERWKAEERNRLLLESSAEGIYGTNTEGRITFMNAAGCRMLGYSTEDLVGQLSHPLFHHHRSDGSVYPQEECPMFAAYKYGKASRIDDEVLWRKDGVAVPVEYGVTPMLKDGAVLGAVISFSDITERKRAEQELDNRLAFQQALLETIPYPMFVKDTEGRFVVCNKAYEREFGTTTGSLKGKTVLELDYLPEAERRKFHEEDMAVIRESSRRSYELPIQYTDGRTHTTLYSVDGFRLSDGRPGGLIGLLVDISDQKRVAEELSEAKAKAEEATQMKSMFLANMSHEIRTPMNAIIGLSYLALKTPLSAKQRDYVSKVHNAGTSLLAIINDILDFSKIEAGKLDLETTEFRLDEVISSVTTLTAQKAHEKGLEFLAHVAPGIPECLLGDPLRLGQILTNFVNNAVKFTERGEVRLNIEQVERTGAKVQLKFSVRDTGIGMSPEQSARLFQPFTQADMSTTRKHGGTGLGLTICRRLVDLMGGRIWLESEAGVGSTFFFTAWLGVGTAKGLGKIIPERLTHLRVLVVDDNPAAREILQEPLSGFVSRVDAVASGKEALAAIRQQDPTAPYDVVFMDWRMPGMDGLEASRHIKSDETLLHPPAIVLVTAFGHEEVRAEADHLHLEGFLLKPVTKSMILDTLVNIFAESEDRGLEGGREESEQANPLAGARILLVEDNEINQQIAVELLEGAGATVQVAGNGSEAVQTLFDGLQPPPFDVVLMDLQMPEMDGYQATAKLRSHPHFGTLPIIAMTAHATIEERQRCLAAGMNDHIAKPIDPAMLFETVGRFYRPFAGGAGAKAAEASAPESSKDLSVIGGLDTKDGLARLGGNRKLYGKLLRQFAEQQGPAVGQISAALAAGDAALAERIAHTLKGVAGNLGAKAVQAAAGALEKLIRAKAAQAEVEAANQQVAATLDPLVAQLKAALGASAPDSSTPTERPAPVDPTQSREAARRLVILLSECDPAAADFVEANRAALHHLFGKAAWPHFEKLVQGYGFAEAQIRLEQALNSHP
jgi:two-component system, sensor histidine kinase and response regulator